MTTIAPMLPNTAPAPEPDATTPSLPGHADDYAEVAARVDRAQRRTGRDAAVAAASDGGDGEPVAELEESTGTVDTVVEADVDDDDIVDTDADTEEPTVPMAAALVGAPLAAPVPAPVAARFGTTNRDVDTAEIGPETEMVALVAPETSAHAVDAEAAASDLDTSAAPDVIDPTPDAADMIDTTSDGAGVATPNPTVDAEPATAEGADASAESADVATPNPTVDDVTPDTDVEGAPRPVPTSDVASRPDAPASNAPAVRGPDAAAAPSSAAAADPTASANATARTEAWEQVATVVRPLRLAADGSHRLALQLRPDELGTVHLEVALRDGRLSVHAVTDTAAGRDVLAQSLPQLRASLTSSGIELGSLDVSTGEPGADGSTRDPADRGGAMARQGGPSTARGASTPLVPTPLTPPAHRGSLGPGAVDLAL
jgi:flagellar hook-length control protein FliK